MNKTDPNFAICYLSYVRPLIDAACAPDSLLIDIKLFSFSSANRFFLMVCQIVFQSPPSADDWLEEILKTCLFFLITLATEWKEKADQSIKDVASSVK
jgi:hypothetical protein